MSSFAILSLDEIFRRADRSARFSITTDVPTSYSVPAAVADPLDVVHAPEELRTQFIEARQVAAPGRSLTLLRDCIVLPNAAVVTCEGNVVLESCFPYTKMWIPRLFAPWIRQEEGGEALYVELADPQFVETPTLYAREHGERGFFHWMHSVFPRLDVLTRQRLAKTWAVLYDTDAPFQRDGLALFDLAGHQLLAPNRQRPQFFRELLFPSPLDDSGDFWLRPPGVAAFYDSIKVPPIEGPRRIYITRRDAQIRHLRNEAALLERLGSRGFQPLELGPLPWASQIALLRNCEAVVSVHGAGLSNIIAMAPGSRVLEILHPRRFWPTYRAIAARRGLHYGFVVGEDENAEGDTFDFEIDLPKVERVLAAMGLR